MGEYKYRHGVASVATTALPNLNEQIRKFLYEARVASRGATFPAKYSPEGAHILTYEKDGWKFKDEWHGTAPFAGFAKISYLGTVHWTMHYWGIFTPAIDTGRVCEVLTRVLSEPLDLAPWRGPAMALVDDYNDMYYNEWVGSIESFHGHESIRNGKGLLLYHADYRGGLVKY